MESDISNKDATTYLSSLLNKSLRIYIQDGRIFVGQMKCTDRDNNIILGLTHEYRPGNSSKLNRRSIPLLSTQDILESHEDDYIDLRSGGVRSAMTSGVVDDNTTPTDAVDPTLVELTGVDNMAVKADAATIAPVWDVGSLNVNMTTTPTRDFDKSASVRNVTDRKLVMSNMDKRFVGLVVVPGRYIVRMEID